MPRGPRSQDRVSRPERGPPEAVLPLVSGEGLGPTGRIRFTRSKDAQGLGRTRGRSPAHTASRRVPGLTSPSLPSHGSLVLMAGKAPPPTGAVDPRPKDSSLGGNSKQAQALRDRGAGRDSGEDGRPAGAHADPPPPRPGTRRLGVHRAVI